MNLDFTSNNQALIRQLPTKEDRITLDDIVAQNNAGEALIVIVPGIRYGTVNFKNEGAGDLIVMHCAKQQVVAAGTAKDLTLIPGGLVDPNAPKPEPAVIAAPAPAAPVGGGKAIAAPVVSDTVKPTAPPQRPAPVSMMNAPIRNRVHG